MNVYYISSAYDGCYYYRNFLPMYHNGWDGDRDNIYIERKNGIQVGREMLESDIVVFHRPVQREKLEAAKLLRQKGIKVVVDNDDTYEAKVPIKVYEKKILDEMRNVLNEFIRFADLVTVSTKYLANEYRKLNKNVIVLPNCIDPDDWDIPLKNNSDKIRVGIVGSTTIIDDIKSFKPILDWLNKQDNIQIIVFGLPPKKGFFEKLYKSEYNFWSKYNIEWQPFVQIKDYFDTLNELRLDIMLIPREDNYFNRCKSNIKFLEASMLEIPVIAQGFKDGNSPYQKDIKNGENGFIALTKSDWKKHIEQLIKSRALRLKIGKTAYHYTLKNYNIHTKAHLWREAYKTI